MLDAADDPAATIAARLDAQGAAFARFAACMSPSTPAVPWQAIVPTRDALDGAGGMVWLHSAEDRRPARAVGLAVTVEGAEPEAMARARVVAHEVAHLIAEDVRARTSTPRARDPHDDIAWHAAVRALTARLYGPAGLADLDAERSKGRDDWPHRLDAEPGPALVALAEELLRHALPPMLHQPPRGGLNLADGGLQAMTEIRWSVARMRALAGEVAEAGLHDAALARSLAMLPPVALGDAYDPVRRSLAVADGRLPDALESARAWTRRAATLAATLAGDPPSPEARAADPLIAAAASTADALASLRGVTGRSVAGEADLRDAAAALARDAADALAALEAIADPVARAFATGPDARPRLAAARAGLIEAEPMLRAAMVKRRGEAAAAIVAEGEGAGRVLHSRETARQRAAEAATRAATERAARERAARQRAAEALS